MAADHLLCYCALTAAAEELPFLSIVVPARAEETWIERSVRSILEQDYPANRMEVIVVVGSAGDRTEDLLARVAATDERVKALENHTGHTPVALNIGIRAARGDIIVRVDAHGTIAPGYLSESVAALRRGDADAVGGVAEFVGDGTATGQAIAFAMGSKLGAGTAAFRSASQATEADTLMWGAYPRALFDRVGMFDERLLRNQDDELCHRIRLHGGRLVVTPSMRFQHAARGSLGALWRQYADWGMFRVTTLAKHGRPGAPRQLIPAALVGSLGGGAGLLAATRGRSRLGWLILGGYLVAVAGAGIAVAAGRGEPRLAPRTAAAITTMQLAYGCGFVAEAGREVAQRAKRG